MSKVLRSKNLSTSLKNIVLQLQSHRIGALLGSTFYPVLAFFIENPTPLACMPFCVYIHLICIHHLKRDIADTLKTSSKVKVGLITGDIYLNPQPKIRENDESNGFMQSLNKFQKNFLESKILNHNQNNSKKDLKIRSNHLKSHLAAKSAKLLSSRSKRFRRSILSGSISSIMTHYTFVGCNVFYLGIPLGLDIWTFFVGTGLVYVNHRYTINNFSSDLLKTISTSLPNISTFTPSTMIDSKFSSIYESQFKIFSENLNGKKCFVFTDLFGNLTFSLNRPFRKYEIISFIS